MTEEVTYGVELLFVGPLPDEENLSWVETWKLSSEWDCVDAAIFARNWLEQFDLPPRRKWQVSRIVKITKEVIQVPVTVAVTGEK